MHDSLGLATPGTAPPDGFACAAATRSHHVLIKSGFVSPELRTFDSAQPPTNRAHQLSIALALELFCEPPSPGYSMPKGSSFGSRLISGSVVVTFMVLCFGVHKGGSDQ